MPSPLESIRHLSETLYQYSNVDDMASHVLRAALEVIGGDAGSILLADGHTKQLVVRHAVGAHVDGLHRVSIPWDSGIAGGVFGSGRTEIIPAVQPDARHESSTDWMTGYQSRDMIVIPLKRHAETPIGVMEVLNKGTGQITRDDLDALMIIASMATSAIERTNSAEALCQKDLQLQQAQKMEIIGWSAEHIAHDFNNLLAGIKGFTQLIAKTLAPDAVSKQYVDQVMKVVKQGRGLTKQLLAYIGNQVLEPQAVNLNDLVSSMEKILRLFIGKRVALFMNLDPRLGQVKAIPVHIEQVLMNLCVNARDAMPKGGSLTIETAMVELDDKYSRQTPDLSPGWYVRLSVTDTGSGMDQATQDKLFKPLFTTKAPGKGTGLGLSIVHGIVKQSHGYVAVASTVGHGTTFTIYLPQVEAEDAGRRIGDRTPTVAQNSEPKSVRSQ
jgi:signal transduction histidine kinase